MEAEFAVWSTSALLLHFFLSLHLLFLFLAKWGFYPVNDCSVSLESNNASPSRPDWRDPELTQTDGVSADGSPSSWQVDTEAVRTRGGV